MPDAPIAQPPIFQQPPAPARRFTVEEYHRMGRAGILTEADRVELLEGWIVQKMIHRHPHDAVIELTAAALRRLLPPDWRVRIQSPITTDDSEPEPDLAVVCGPIRRHLRRHPQPQEIALVVEVAGSSLARDRAKARLYARAGIAVYWIINLVDGCVETCRDPDRTAADYRLHSVLRAGEAVAVAIADQEIGRIAVAELLP